MANVDLKSKTNHNTRTRLNPAAAKPTTTTNDASPISGSKLRKSSHEFYEIV